MKFVEQLAAQKAGNISGWDAFSFECVGSDRKTIKVKGGVPRILQRGKRKGQKCWDGEVQTEFVTDQEIEQARREYEVRTGNCSECAGSGKVFAGWSAAKGAYHRECRDCKGSGKAGGAE